MNRSSTPTEHGGVFNLNKRKTARPIVVKNALHVVLRTTFTLLTNKVNVLIIKNVLSEATKRYNVKIYNCANVGNHLHLVISGKSKKAIQDFLRYITSRTSQLITKACKGKKLLHKFWQYICYTRVVSWGRDYKGVYNYIDKNIMSTCDGDLGLFEARKQLYFFNSA